MKSQSLAITLVCATLSAAAMYPLLPSTAAVSGTDPIPDIMQPIVVERPLVEAVFVLDTTGSMGGLIEAAKEKIWSIATTMAAAQPTPRLRIGLVAYRDRGDSFVTRVFDLSEDLDSLYAQLMDFEAEGGGDGPESVNQALYDAVHQISWDNSANTYKTLFLVGDAPPHTDYQDDVPFAVSVADARSRGIRVNTIQCGTSQSTRSAWQQIAQLGQGDFFQVDQSGSAIAMRTPFDERLAALSEQLDATRLYYGDAEQQAKHARKKAATEKLHEAASPATRARRATFNASAAGSDNLLGEGDLIEDLHKGRIELEAVPTEALPAPLQSLDEPARVQLIERTHERRQALQKEIEELAEERADYLRRELDDSAATRDSLDAKIFATVRDQAAEVGLSYETSAPAY